MTRILILFFVLLGQIATAQIDYKSYHTLLQKHVSRSGQVNYQAIKANRMPLDSVIGFFNKNAPQATWSRNEQLAYWLNAYNIFTIRLIVDNFPTQSITKLEGGKPWDAKRVNIGGKMYSLNQIENEIIRPQFKDPRIHFALNCAAKSCPSLHNEAFTASNLDKLLDQRTRAFIRSSGNQLGKDAIKISKIFDWYAADFGDLVAFLNRYASVKINPKAKVEYLEYDWGLNQ
jgi:Protein of unknown function, DUF547